LYPALIGKSMQETFLILIMRLSIMLLKEGVDIVTRAILNWFLRLINGHFNQTKIPWKIRKETSSILAV